MNRQRWKRVKGVLTDALKVPADRRSAVVAQLCGDDRALRLEVQQLLEEHETMDDQFLEPPNVED